MAGGPEAIRSKVERFPMWRKEVPASLQEQPLPREPRRVRSRQLPFQDRRGNSDLRRSASPRRNRPSPDRECSFLPALWLGRNHDRDVAPEGVGESIQPLRAESVQLAARERLPHDRPLSSNGAYFMLPNRCLSATHTRGALAGRRGILRHAATPCSDSLAPPRTIGLARSLF